MANRVRLTPRQHIELSLDEILLAKVQLQLFDPVTETVPKGAISFLVNMLLREWLERQGIR